MNSNYCFEILFEIYYPLFSLSKVVNLWTMVDSNFEFVKFTKLASHFKNCELISVNLNLFLWHSIWNLLPSFFDWVWLWIYELKVDHILNLARSQSWLHISKIVNWLVWIQIYSSDILIETYYPLFLIEYNCEFVN